jgi:GDSL-like Lipase/Acylhydrolase family
MDSSFAFRRKHRLTTRPSLRARSSLPISSSVILSFVLATALTYGDDSRGRSRWDRDRDQHSIGTWATSPEAGTTSFNNQTLRLIAHVSVGGDEIRIRFSNAYGTTSLSIGAAHIALRATGAQIVPASDCVLTFSGQSSITIPPGALIVSDPMELAVPALGDLAVSVYLPGNTGPATFHAEGKQTSYISPSGDFAGNIALPTSSTALSSFFLTNVEVKSSNERRAIVTLGDSITDGTASTPDSNHRWPNFLADRLQASHRDRDVGVLDQGISGNRILHDIAGTNALARLDRDVLSQTYYRVHAMSDNDGQAWLDAHMHRAEKLIYIYYLTAAVGLIDLCTNQTVQDRSLSGSFHASIRDGATFHRRLHRLCGREDTPS